jgi:hypothetical protein
VDYWRAWQTALAHWQREDCRMVTVLTYAVECDFRPYQQWIVEAESESEARLMVAQMLGVPFEETDAAIKREQNTQ